MTLFAGICLIGTLLAWFEERNKVKRRKIRDRVLSDLEEEWAIQERVRRYGMVLDSFNTEKRDGLLQKYVIGYSTGDLNPSTNDCPSCKRGFLLTRRGRHGSFLACSKFPTCKYTSRIVSIKGEYKDVVTDEFMNDIQKAYG